MNYKITIGYDGTAYHGWQLQADLPTVQLVVQDALAAIAGRPVVAHSAGRTDAGVHAAGQVVSFRLQSAWQGTALRKALNGNLPFDVRVFDATLVDDDFHARYSASRKTYRYTIVNAEVMDPLLERYAWHYPYPIPVHRLRAEAELLMGCQDFSAFTTNDCVTTSTIRTINEIRIDQIDSNLVLVFTGDGFLRYQVRTMVAALVASSRGRLGAPLDQIVKLGKRDLIPGMAPARGLTLMSVEY